MTFKLVIVVVGLAGVLFLISAVRNFRSHRAIGTMLCVIATLAL